MSQEHILQHKIREGQ